MVELYEELDAAWFNLSRSSLYARWKKDNPREEKIILDYWNSNNKIPVPNVTTMFGKALIHIASTRFKLIDKPITSFPPPSSLPPFTPIRIFTVTNLSQLQNAISNIQAGDLVYVSAFDVPLGTQVFFINKRLETPARFVFENGFRILGTERGSGKTTVFVYNCDKLQFVGGDITSGGNDGIRIFNSTNKKIIIIFNLFFNIRDIPFIIKINTIIICII